jgi:molybdopterin-guanine dinucleotide biosynthesis protein A
MVPSSCGGNLVSARANDKKSAVFDRKQTFYDKKTAFPDLLTGLRCGVHQFPFPPFISSGDTPMIRRRLFATVAIIASVVLTACSDMTAPKNDVGCPITSGSSTCK